MSEDGYGTELKWSALRDVHDDMAGMLEDGLHPRYEPVWEDVNEFDRFLIEEEHPELYERLEDFADTVDRFRDDVEKSRVDSETAYDLAEAIEYRQLKVTNNKVYVKTGYQQKTDLQDYLDDFKVEIATAGSQEELTSRLQQGGDPIGTRAEGWYSALWDGLESDETAVKEELGSDDSWPMYYVELVDDAEAITGMIEEAAQDELLG